MAHVMPTWTPKMTKLIWLVGIPPSVILILVFGILPASKSAHFQTAHGVSPASHLRMQPL